MWGHTWSLFTTTHPSVNIHSFCGTGIGFSYSLLWQTLLHNTWYGNPKGCVSSISCSPLSGHIVGLALPFPSEFRFDHVTWFGQWNVSRCDICHFRAKVLGGSLQLAFTLSLWNSDQQYPWQSLLWQPEPGRDGEQSLHQLRFWRYLSLEHNLVYPDRYSGISTTLPF